MPVIVSKQHQKLVIPYNNAVETLWPDAKRLDAGMVLDHNVANTLLLRRIGFQVPSPISMYYDWPAPADEPAFQAQKASALLFSEANRAYNFSDMGTGKSRAALWAFDYLNKTQQCKKMLVVCPISVMHLTWGHEIFTIMPGRKYSVLYGSKKQRLEALAVDADIYIVNTDGIKVIAKEISDRKDIDVLLIDEVASFRNNSQRSKLLRKFAQPFNIVWAMSGRPLPSSPVDAWAIAKIVTPALAPKYQRQARDELMTQISQYKWLPKPNAVETAFKMMQPAIRFALEDVTELPELIVREPLEIPLSKQQAEVYKRIKTELTAMVEDKTITAHNAGVAMGKLLQVSCGWVYSKAPAFVKLDAEPRINALLDMVESASHKVIVFVPFRHAIEGISEIFTAHEIDHAVMHGDIGADARAVLLNAFQNSDQYRVLLAHPGTISHGVTLTAADTICWYSPVLSLEIFEQANARIRRVGQTKKQQIIRFSGTAVERRVYSLLQSKSNLQDQLLVMLEEATDAS